MRDGRSMEQIYRSAVSGLYARLRSNYGYLCRRFGDDGLQMIEEMSREYGLSIAERAGGTLKSRDINAVAQYLLRIFETVTRGRDTVTVESEDGRVILKVTRCPLQFDDVGMCRAHTTMEKTVVEQLNPGLTYYIGKSIPAGDAFCEHIIEERRAKGKHADQDYHTKRKYG
jgi:hypothetical protein